MNHRIDQAAVIAALRGAAPYIRLYKGKVFVIKAGGAIFGDIAGTRSLVEQIAILHHLGIRVVLVHGGGPQLDEMQRSLGIEPRMVRGRRVTDDRSIDATTMVLNGLINTRILATCRELGIDAVLDDDRLAERRAKARGERRALLLGERHRAAYAGAHAAGVGIDEVAVRGRDVGQLLAPALIGHETHEIADELRGAEPLGDLVGHRALGCGGDPGPREELQQLGIAGDHFDDPIELLTDDVRLVALPGELEQRLGIRARGVL